MPKLRVQEIATERGLNMSQLQKKAAVTMPSIRRYWYNTRDGKAIGEPLTEIDLKVLAAIAGALGVKSRDLFTDEDWATLYLAAA
jgi:transcriptional regulator with XRE-family HTH domain